MGVLESLANATLNIFILIGIWINSMIYNLVSFLFDIFVSIISAQIFTEEDVLKIANSVYLVIGVVTLFIIAYALLRAIIDPDSASKGNYSVKKIIPNVLLSIFLIAFVPTMFKYAYQFQNVVIDTNLIPNVMLGQNLAEGSGAGGECDLEANPNGQGCTPKQYLNSSGRQMANSVFVAFFVPTETPEGGDYSSYYEQLTLTDCWLYSCDDDEYTFKQAISDVSAGKKGFGIYAEFADWMHGKEKEKNKIEYNWLLQLICGCVLVYVLINFCIDMAVRAVKLGYFQIIAPIPILTIMIPGQRKIFDNWSKSTINTFIDVFIRIAVIFLGVVLINNLPDLGDNFWANTVSDPKHPVWAKAFIIVGILIFMKQAPKLISDIFGISGSSFKLGIKDKIGEMAFVGGPAKDLLSKAPSVTGAATGAAGAAWTAVVNKGKPGKAALLGAIQGSKGGGNQFNKQRKSLWTDTYKMGGTPGIFGGKPMYNQTVDELRNTVNDEFLQFDEKKGLGANSLAIKDLEASGQYSDLYTANEHRITDLVNNLHNAETPYLTVIANVQANVDAKNVELQSKQTQLDSLTKDYNDMMNKAKNDYIGHLNTERDKAFATGNSAEVAYFGQKIQEAQAGNATHEIMNYISGHDEELNKNIQENTIQRNVVETEIQTINREIQTGQTRIATEQNNMNHDQKVIDARKEINEVNFVDKNGKKLELHDSEGRPLDSITTASQVSKDYIDGTVRNLTRGDFKKVNEEYAWRVAKEDSEKVEKEVKTKKGSADYILNKEMFEDVMKKYGGSDKK